MMATAMIIYILTIKVKRLFVFFLVTVFSKMYIFFCCDTKDTTNKTGQTLLTIPVTVRYLYYILYTTSLEYNSYTTFYSFWFFI